MQHLRISSLSTEYVRVPVAMLDDDGVLTDPSAEDVEIAFTIGEHVEPEDSGLDEALGWEAAEWETSELVAVEVGAGRASTPYKARILVGPGGTVLTDGEYTVWVKIATDAETIVRACRHRLIVS